MRILRCPYRKPTQVDGMSILRPTGEGLLRNSANWPRNFGIRGACESRPVPVPQTDTGRWDEYSKANWRRVVKEIGKLAP